MSAPGSLSALLNSASAYYRRAGHFAWHFARGKLKGDPVFRAILEHGLLADRARLLDLGAGQGLLAAWLLAARSCQASEQDGAWPAHWPAPPELQTYLGIEINAQEVRRAQRAFALNRVEQFSDPQVPPLRIPCAAAGRRRTHRTAGRRHRDRSN